MKKPSRPPPKSPMYFEQVPVKVVRKLVVAATVKPPTPGRKQPAVLPFRAKADR